MTRPVRTPCIGVCSTGIGDSVCRGCKRFAHEIIGWNAYSDHERGHILRRREMLLSQVVQARLEIVDPEQVERQLRLHKFAIHADADPYYQVFQLIQAFSRQLPDLQSIGCRAREEWQELSVSELRTSIDDDFFRLSCAHYERYFPGHL